jgi:AAA+ superfamily predicted ATPase
MTDSTDNVALRYLVHRFDFYERLLLERLLGEDEADGDLTVLATAIRQFEAMVAQDRQVLPLDYVRDRTGVSGVAEDVLLLAVAAELDPRFSALIARYYGSPAEGYVSLGLCQELLGGDREARLEMARLLRPGSLLLDTGLLSLVPRDGARRGRAGAQLVSAPYLSSFLLGDMVDPEPVHDVAETVQPTVTLADVSLADALRDRLRRLVTAPPLAPRAILGRHGPGGYDVPPGMSVLLTGPMGSGRRLVVTGLAGELGRHLLRVDCDRLLLSSPPAVLGTLRLLVEYAWFTNRWLVFEDCERLLGPGPDRRDDRFAPALAALLRRVSVTAFFTAEAPDKVGEAIRQLLFGCVALPPADRKRLQEICALNVPADRPRDPDLSFEKLVEKRVLSGIAIRNAAALAARDASRDEASRLEMAGLEWATAGLEAASLGTLATRAYQSRTLADLILPRDVKRQVESIIETVHVRRRVHREWGFDRLSSRGLGLSCLFHGDSGTGKTLAAEVIANEVGLPLYQVNMAAIVSKYIGETSKNLSRVFDEASRSRCVLLFDEADAMFSKRTDVKKSTDRYSNMEINLLLQLIEGYDGITICTTNLKKGIDQAFERRFSSVIHFPSPEKELRLAIWRHHLPPDAPVAPDLDEGLTQLAEEFDLSGGSIRSVVLRAAYQAAVEGSAITAKHLRDSARQEYRAIGKLVRQNGDEADW